MTCTRQRPSLPVELLDHTVDFLHDDLDTLWSCTSVSHTFLRSARYHLFHTLSVADEPSEHGGRGYAKFLQFLERTPEVRAYIHQIKLTRYHSPDEHLPVPEVCSHILGEIISYLPRLHTLALGKGIHVACHCIRVPRHQDPVKLHSLSLDSVRVATAKDWEDLLPLFAAIQNLSISDLCISQGPRKSRSAIGGEETPIVGNQLDVETIVLDTARAHEFATFETLSTGLCRALHFPALKSVTFGFDHQSQVEPFGALLARSAAHLENLTLRLPAHPYAAVRAEEWRHLQLPSFKQLKTLTFIEEPPVLPSDAVVDVFSGEANRTVCRSIKDILQHAPSSLEHLHFCFKLRAFGTGSAGQLMDHFDWSEMEEMARQCEKMKQVTFALQGRPEGDHYLQMAIVNRLAVLNARGLLQINFEA